MKNMIWSFLFFFMLLGCNDDDNTNQEEQEQEEEQYQDPRIYGTWRLVEVGGGVYGAEGFHYVSRSIPNGYIIGFFEDLRFTSICSENGEELDDGNVWGPCWGSNGKNMDGSYTISDSYVISNSLTLDDGDFIALAREVFEFHFEDRYLFLYNIRCIEGCHDKFERVQETEEE